jgi:hypothetical protein
MMAWYMSIIARQRRGVRNGEDDINGPAPTRHTRAFKFTKMVVSFIYCQPTSPIAGAASSVH